MTKRKHRPLNILAAILLFVDVEKRIGKEQEEIKVRREQA